MKIFLDTAEIDEIHTAKVKIWLQIAASVEGFIGFAVGRTTFWRAIADLVAKKITSEQAASRIAQRYGEWVAIFERAHHSQAAHVV
jgi:myo-inositol catabolism protein IolC